MSSDGIEAVMGRARIFVRDLRLPARVGVNPGEQGSEQPVVVDIWLEMDDLTRPARSEKLADTVDYVTVARTVRRVVARRHYPLVETLASEAARAVLALDGVVRARVRLQKPGCLRRASAAGVEVELARSSAPLRLTPVAPAELPGSPTPREDIVVLGGGAAGLSAALWCWRLGHPALLVEPRARLGGQLHMVHGAMPDLPGFEPLDGPTLVRRLERQFAAHGGRWLRARMTSLSAGDAGCDVGLELTGEAGHGDPLALRSRAVILALGSRRRVLGVPGERELRGRGLLFTAARGAEELAARRVVVVGGGDSGCENSLILHRAGARVTLVHRGARPSARRQFADEVLATSAIERLPGARVAAFVGGRRLREVVLRLNDGREQPVEADAALVRIGWQPNSDGLPPEWLDEQGFVKLGAEGSAAARAQVFVAGEVGGPLSSSVAGAFGGGAAAARAATLYLEATGR